MLFYRAEKPPFFSFFFFLKRTRFPGKRESIWDPWQRGIGGGPRTKCLSSQRNVFSRRDNSLSLSLFLSLAFPSLYFSISFFLFLFLPREETLKHAPNWLMFKRARAFSWQQHLKLSIVFQSPCLRGDFGGRSRSIWKNQARQISGKSWRERNSLIIYIEREKGRRKIWKIVACTQGGKTREMGKWVGEIKKFIDGKMRIGAI